MILNNELKDSVERLIQGISLTDLMKSSAQLSTGYKDPKGKIVVSKQQKLAYLVARLPATYAAIYQVLMEVKRGLPELEVKSMGDIGAGPGTGMWAAAELFPEMTQVSLYEQDKEFIGLGKQLASGAGLLSTIGQSWSCMDLLIGQVGVHDLVLASYSLGELPREKQEGVLERLWESARGALVVIEPGTPLGFERIRRWRSFLIEKGACLVAPCPHTNACPMKEKDWCHFYARVERSSWHRKIKSGTLNFEDEKFSYLVVSRQKSVPISGRIIRHPQKNSGHVLLRICGQNGIEEKVITKKSPEVYRKARKAEWGDVNLS